MRKTFVLASLVLCFCETPPVSAQSLASDVGNPTQISEATVLELREWGALKYGQVEDPVFEIGKAFLGYAIEGKIRIENQSDRDVTLSKIKTSCGCAVAQKLNDSIISPGEKYFVALSIRRRNTGPFATSVQMTIDGREHLAIVKGQINRNFAFPSTVSSKNRTAAIRVSVFNPKINLDSLKLISHDRDIEITGLPMTGPEHERLYEIEFSGKSIPGRLNLTPQWQNNLYPAAGIDIIEQGKLSILPSVVYVSKSANRLVFSINGDVNDLSVDNVFLVVRGKSSKLNAKIRRTKRSVIVIAENPINEFKAARLRAAINIGGQSIPFTIQMR